MYPFHSMRKFHVYPVYSLSPTKICTKKLTVFFQSISKMGGVSETIFKVRFPIKKYASDCPMSEEWPFWIEVRFWTDWTFVLNFPDISMTVLRFLTVGLYLRWSHRAAFEENKCRLWLNGCYFIRIEELVTIGHSFSSYNKWIWVSTHLVSVQCFYCFQSESLPFLTTKIHHGALKNKN